DGGFIPVQRGETQEEIVLELPLVCFLRQPPDRVCGEPHEIGIRIHFREMAKRKERQPSLPQRTASRDRHRPFTKSFWCENTIPNVRHHQRSRTGHQVLHPNLLRELKLPDTFKNRMSDAFRCRNDWKTCHGVRRITSRQVDLHKLALWPYDELHGPSRIADAARRNELTICRIGVNRVVDCEESAA